MSNRKVEKQAKQDKLRNYLEENVSFVFERLMVEMLAVLPEDMIGWTINWLDSKGRMMVQSKSKMSRTQSSFIPQQEQENQKTQLKELKKLLSQTDDDDESDIEELPQIPVKKKMGARASVSAECYGQFNKKENFVARVIPKQQDQKDRIVKRLMQSFMFQALEDKERDIVIDAFEERRYLSGDWVITQGEDGDNLYVVDQGELDCFKKFQKDADNTYLKTYKPGESFGELSLLYNAPRAASIQSKTDSILFALDRATFNNIVKDAAMKKREKYEGVLKRIDLLASMDPYETTHVCDGIKERKVKAGEFVIRQGDKGDAFYMIEEGALIATKVMEPDTEAVNVYEYKAGMYFGEIALLKDVPRQANVIATTDSKLIYLDSSSFRRLLGPVEDILKRNFDRYQKYLNQ